MVQKQAKVKVLEGTSQTKYVGNSRATQRMRECGAQWHRAKAWLQGHGKSGHLSDQLHQKAPRRYFTFTFSILLIYEHHNRLIMCNASRRSECITHTGVHMNIAVSEITV